MTTTLRLVLDQLVAPTDALLASASLELARALVASAPRGCEVEALVPATSAGAPDVAELVPGLARVTRAPLARRELSAAWQLGVGPLSGGMVHAPTMMAPLVRHDRAHSGDQTVVTINKLDLWTAPDELARGELTVKALRDGSGAQTVRSLSDVAAWAATLQSPTLLT